MLSTGRFLYEYISHTEGIRRLEKAYEIKETPWINYLLGVAYSLNWQHLILPFYRHAGYLDIHYKITLLLIKHLEGKRKYKEANNLYRELLS